MRQPLFYAIVNISIFWIATVLKKLNLHFNFKEMNLFIILYLVGFLRTLLIIAVIYYGIKLVAKYVLPMLVDKGVKNMQQKMQNQQNQNQKPSRPDGEVTIETNKNNNQNSKNSGEYVDFEEVE